MSKLHKEVDSVIPMRYCLTKKTTMTHQRLLSLCFHHGDRASTMWGENALTQNESNDEAVQWCVKEEVWNNKNTHTPVDDRSIIDRVVERRRMNRQVHLFSCWSVVRHETICRAKKIAKMIFTMSPSFPMLCKEITMLTQRKFLFFETVVEIMFLKISTATYIYKTMHREKVYFFH